MGRSLGMCVCVHVCVWNEEGWKNMNVYCASVMETSLIHIMQSEKWGRGEVGCVNRVLICISNIQVYM